ncbi:MAG: sigma-54-dependent Fis family transcriptional regulator [Deltaproteobacteria bacterium]|nr:sigma-54-dependent Fis family transcriptional regulator [Deltaproteobacteria bacterium]
MTRASILVVDDEELIRWSLQKELVTQGYSVTTAATRAEALRGFSAEPADVVLLDIKLPDGSGLELIPELFAVRADVAILMITSVNSVETAVEAMRLGAADYVTKPFDFPKLWNSVARSAERVQLREINRVLRTREEGSAETIIAASVAMKRTLELSAKLTASDAATVLLLGESGVGKDLLARHIHRTSPRAERLFLDINCAALPDTLLESELFGHERGAFTDAKTQKRGLFELANGGTVYLDEIADAPLVVQAKLLKVLEQRTFRRVGGVRDLVADVRVIAATNRDLTRAVEHGSFREDLLYRLKVFPISIPPLRERKEDILPLARSFLLRFGRTLRKQPPELDAETAELLESYRWPGNIRELKNVIERAVILADGETIARDLLPPEVVHGPEPAEPEGASGALALQEARLIQDALAAAAGNLTKAALKLGIGRDALRRKMKKLGVS